MPGFSPLLQVKEPEVVGAELMAWQQARKQLWFLLQDRMYQCGAEGYNTSRVWYISWLSQNHVYQLD
jgi:hypothetical protein